MSFTTGINSIPRRAGPARVFARIRPSNDDAIEHFDNIVNSMTYGFLHHHENFIRINDYKSRLGDVQGHSQRWGYWSPAKNPKLARPVWTGEFILYIRPDPPIRRNKWRIGGVYEIDGHVQPRGETQSDLLLWDKDEPTDKHHEAELFFDRISGILTIRGRCESNKNSMTLDSEDASSSTHLLNENSHKLQFGRCAYLFQYEFIESLVFENDFQQDKIAFFSDRLKIGPPIFWTSLTPTINLPKLKNWVIHGIVSSKGVSGIVRAASKSSPPQCAAVKTMVRVDRETTHFIAKEIQTGIEIRNLLKRKPCPFILKFIEEEYELDPEEWDRDRAEQVHLIFTPLCNKNFYDLVNSSDITPIEDRLSLLHNVIQGLEWLHSNDFVHRDIKLENLGVVYQPKAKAVILDFGVIHRGTKNLDFRRGPVGTIDYVAPEMESEPYDEKVDIWALGIVAYRMFIAYDLPWMMDYEANPWKMEMLPTEAIASDAAFLALGDRYNNFYLAMAYMANMEDPNTTDVRDLIGKMMAWDADKRPSAQACSLHPCFRNRADNGES